MINHPVLGSVYRSKAPEYHCWNAMMRRCGHLGTVSHPNYAGRGIAVCKRWHDFQNFIDDMGPRPSAKHSIDRIRGHLGYAVGNCRWATQKEQARNTEVNVHLTHKGRTQLATDWSRELNISGPLLSRRLQRGWTVEKALSTPTTRGFKCDAKELASNRVREEEIRVRTARPRSEIVRRQREALLRMADRELAAPTALPSRDSINTGAYTLGPAECAVLLETTLADIYRRIADDSFPAKRIGSGPRAMIRVLNSEFRNYLKANPPPQAAL